MAGTLCGLLEELAQPGLCWGLEQGRAGLGGVGVGPCWLLGTLSSATAPSLGSSPVKGAAVALLLPPVKVQKRLIRFEHTTCSADTKYDCDYYLALEESFPQTLPCHSLYEYYS